MRPFTLHPDHNLDTTSPLYFFNDLWLCNYFSASQSSAHLNNGILLPNYLPCAAIVMQQIYI